MKILRQHQIEALNAMNNNNEGIIHLPTGTGKTLIQASYIVEHLNGSRVFVILSPRILLTNQLYTEVKNILLSKNKDVQYLIVHSGNIKEKTDLTWTSNMPYREVKSTTSSKTIKDDYDRALRENVDLIIFSTYDSAERIVKSNIPVFVCLCDEAHNIVSTEFEWVRKENINGLCFNSENKFYFTATLKETMSNVGLGMNNHNEFGKVLYSKTPLEMVQSGDILRPRMHLVDIVGDFDNELDADVNAILDSFTEHRAQNRRTNTKMLVVTKGSEHLDQIINHPKVKDEIELNRNLKIYDITSANGARINGVEVKREDFLSDLKSHDGDAIILHVRILTEGIDVPGITGVMIMNDLSLSAFLQTLGRATRLDANDRKKLYNDDIKWSDNDKMTKPYAWVIVPTYGKIGSDIRENVKSMVYNLRTYGFTPAEDVVIKENNGKSIPVPLEQLNELDTRNVLYKNEFINIVHEVEEQESADKFIIENFRLSEEIKNESIEESLNRVKNIDFSKIF